MSPPSATSHQRTHDDRQLTFDSDESFEDVVELPAVLAIARRCRRYGPVQRGFRSCLDRIQRTSIDAPAVQANQLGKGLPSFDS